MRWLGRFEGVNMRVHRPFSMIEVHTMRTIQLTLLALVFGLSACSFSLASGPGPHAAYPGTLAAMHGPGKPARRVIRNAAPAIAKADRPARPTELDQEPDPPARPKRVGRADPPKPEPPAKPTRVGRADPEPPKLVLANRAIAPKPEPSATPTFVLANKAIAPKPEPPATPTFVVANRALAPKPEPKARPKLVLPARVVEPTPRP